MIIVVVTIDVTVDGGHFHAILQLAGFCHILTGILFI